jgi:DNA (cytosine-5)-methyltransferase 1
MTLRVMDLFSGIGGFSLGLKRAGGFRTVAYCEIDPYCQQVLLARMSDGSLDTAPICTDVTKLDGEPWRGRVDLICGGFPCQDISVAGKMAGIDGERSGLWREIARLVRQVRPSYVFVENVAALLVRGIGRVLGDLAACGYDAEWDVIPACAVGALHIRERVWILAYPRRQRVEEPQLQHADIPGRPGYAEAAEASKGPDVADTICFNGWGNIRKRGAEVTRSGWWETEPNVGRVANGVPARVDRLRALGNSVVPQVVEWIGRRIAEVDRT